MRVRVRVRVRVSTAAAVVAKREAGEEVFVPLDLPTALAGHLEGGQLTWLGLGLGLG